MTDGNLAGQRPLSHTFVDVLRVIRAPLFFSVLAFLFFWLPSQTREVYRILADNPRESAAEVIIGLVAIVLVSVILWYNGVVCTRQQKLIPPAETRASLRVQEFALGIVVLLPLIGILLGILDAYSGSADFPPTAMFYVGLLSLIAIAAGVTLPRLGRSIGGSWVTQLPAHLALLVVLALASLPLFVPWEITPHFSADTFSAFLGPIAVFCLFIAFAATLTAFLSHNYNRNGIPLIILLLAGAFLLSNLDLDNDNEIATYPPKPDAKLQRVSSAFAEWLEERKGEFTSYTRSGAKYPVFIVTAEGGGITAGYHTAIALARIQETCPRFARHVFAISAVSGGALGGAVFQALASEAAVRPSDVICHDTPPSERPIEDTARIILSGDYLSSMVGAGLFPNLAQYWLPISVPAWDRSRAFERAIVAAWNKTNGRHTNPFRQSFLDHWRRPGGHGPALFLNMTHAESGQRITISPMHFHGDDKSPGGGVKNLLSISEDLSVRGTSEGDEAVQRDLDLATAVGLSSRFPWVSSAGSLRLATKDGSKSTLHLVDGGYADNSGVETARDVYRVIKDTEAARDVEFHFVIIFDDSFRPPSEFRELQGPVEAAFNARKERGKQTMLRVWAEMCAADESCRSPNEFFKLRSVVWLLLNDPRANKNHGLPLGWRLSKKSREIIDSRIGRVEQCHEKDNWGGTHTGQPGCAAWQIRDTLRPKGNSIVDSE